MSKGYYQFGQHKIAIIEGDCAFPPISKALAEPNGLLAIGGDLGEIRLLSAYKQGIFPWFSQHQPIIWWSPHPRMVLVPQELVLARSLKKVVQQQRFEIRINSAFEQVVRACANTARPEQDGTWIMPEMISAYTRLHQLGYAHSVEAWQNGQLVGGCYGVKIGRMFYGESMFYHLSNASKVAFVHMVEWLKGQDVRMIDCQMNTPLLASFGAKEIPREQFLQRLNFLIAHDTP